MAYYEEIVKKMISYNLDYPSIGETPEVWTKKIYDFICFLEKKAEGKCSTLNVIEDLPQKTG